VYSKNGGDAFYIIDGRFVTGQDPTSASKVASEVLKILKANFKTVNGNAKSDLE